MGSHSPKPKHTSDSQVDALAPVPEPESVPPLGAPAQIAQQPVVPAAPSAAVQPAATRPPTEDERSFMTRLRTLTETEPARAVELARRGNSLYPSGSDGAERGWVICKALTNLGQFDEAYAEAKLLAERYPGTTWSLDVIKHILINPRTHPSERGYGKKSEFD
jgi:hypothetical protein